MINNPLINNPFRINVKGKLTKDDFNGHGQIARDRQTGEVQYGLPFNIESIGMRNNFLYKILLIYTKAIFNEDEMLLDMRIAEDTMITMGITIFENPSGNNRYVLGAGYINHPVPQLEIDVLLDEEEKALVDGYVADMKKQINWDSAIVHAYHSNAFIANPKEAFNKVLNMEEKS
ncbi:MAG: hypothetical protein IJE43_02990 [Alphaproteobacteria bacterium]|nr:hypothetical protein [Alphaproteobacteria bacterium]MBQ6886269.1 hypothetical protein [Lachnospiraceae bacterium]